MTYLYEYKILDDNIKVEYVFSTVADEIKVVDMWVDDKPHDVNWMSPEGRAKLMTRLEDDFTNRICGTNDEESYMDNLMTTGFDVDTEVDLDRDMPGFEGTMDALEDMVDGVVGEPEFLGGRYYVIFRLLWSDSL